MTKYYGVKRQGRCFDIQEYVLQACATTFLNFKEAKTKIWFLQRYPIKLKQYREDQHEPYARMACTNRKKNFFGG